MRPSRMWGKLQRLSLTLTASIALLLGCTPPEKKDVQIVSVSSLEELIYSKDQAQSAQTIDRLFRLVNKVREDTVYTKRLAWVVVQAGYRYDVPPELIASVIVVESYLDSTAISSAGAVGLMQIMPNWWAGVYPECGSSLPDPETNICYGTRILSWYLEYFDHKVLSALNGYSGGAIRYGARVLTVLGAFHILESKVLEDEHGPHTLTYMPL